MAAVDYERVLLGLKAHIGRKRSHGQDELLRAINDLETRYAVPEGQEVFDNLPLRRVPTGNSTDSDTATAA